LDVCSTVKAPPLQAQDIAPFHIDAISPYALH
jgi:hypothetical protein